jgi:hypothetical protein
MRVLKKTSDFLASYKLSCVLFLLMLVLTYLGTMYQVEHGLYQSQKKYFESLVLIHWAFDTLPIPMPGGYLVMALAFVNLLWGAILRLRRGWSKAGIFIAHLGILLLLVGSFVTYSYSFNGHMALYEGQSSSEVESSFEWEIGVAETGTTTEYIVHQKDFEQLIGNRSLTFKFAKLPFDLTLQGYASNAMVAKADTLPGRAVEGQVLKAQPLDREWEQNVAGVYATAVEKEGGAKQDKILWAANEGPVQVTVGGKSYSLQLRKRRFPLPFSIRLDKFVRELHPRTNMPRVFTSEVTKTEDGASQQVKITMNEPLRHRGYTFYQSSWGPPNAGPNDRLYSVFAVVKNPTDQVPLYACIVTTAGLILHFLQKLIAYLRSERAKRS